MRGFRECRWGYIALGICIAEISSVWGSLAAVYALGIWGNAPRWLADVFMGMYLAGLAAVGIATVGLRKHSSRGLAGLALLLGVVNLVVCAIPIAGLR